MNPFGRYPRGGRVPFGRPKNPYNARHGQALELYRKTGQGHCAWCGVGLTDDYYRWLLVVVDHVVPTKEASRLGIPSEYSKDFINLVLACSGCNGLVNRYRVRQPPKADWTLVEFLALRDEIFEERAELIAQKREREKEFFLAKWCRTGGASAI